MKIKRLICLFVALTAIFVCSCGEELQNASAGIWEKDGKLPYDYSLTDYVVLGDYNGIPMPELEHITYDENAAVTARASLLVENTVDDLSALERFTGIESLVAGDIVKADISMTVDGKECDISAQKDCTVIIDGGTQIEDVSDPYIAFLAGKAAENAVRSESGKASFVCPDYYEDSRYAGKTVTVCTKINNIAVQEHILTEADDSAVAAHTDYKTVAELFEALSAELLQKKTEAEKYAAKRIMWQRVVNDSTIFTPLPKTEADRCKSEYINHYRQLASYNGCSYTEYISREGLSQSEIISAADDYAAKKVREELVAFAIADEELLLLTKPEYEEQAYKLAAQLGYAGYEELLKHNSEAALYTYLTWEKASDFIYEKAIIQQETENE